MSVESQQPYYHRQLPPPPRVPKKPLGGKKEGRVDKVASPALVSPQQKSIQSRKPLPLTTEEIVLQHKEKAVFKHFKVSDLGTPVIKTELPSIQKSTPVKATQKQNVLYAKKQIMAQITAISETIQVALDWFEKESISLELKEINFFKEISRRLAHVEEGDLKDLTETVDYWIAEVATWASKYPVNVSLKTLQSLLTGAQMRLSLELKKGAQGEQKSQKAAETKKTEPIRNYNNARLTRQNLEERELRQHLGKYKNLLNDLVESSRQLRREDLPLKQRLAQLQIHGKLLKRASRVLAREIRREVIHPAIVARSAWAISRKVEKAFKQELTAFVAVEELTYRHFEAERKNSEIAFWKLNYLDFDTSKMVKEWSLKRKGLEKTANLEDRKILLAQYREFIESYTQWKTETLEREKSARVEQLAEKKKRGIVDPKQSEHIMQLIHGLERQVQDLAKLNKTIKAEQDALGEYLSAKHLATS